MKTNLILWGGLLCLLLLSSCEKENEGDKLVPVTGVTLTPTTTSLNVGDTLTLTATVAPDNATNKTVTWTSSNPAVATVVNAGLVTAIAPGDATIVVTTQDGNKTATCVVTVTKTPVAITGVKLDKTTAMLNLGGTMTLTATVLPDNAANKAVTWESDKTDIAIVDANGKVTAVKIGTANITVTTKDANKTATCKVTVALPMIMTTENNDEMRIAAIGTGIVTVDWGDGATQDYTLVGTHDIRHKYSTVASYTITVTGENITDLNCYDNQLTSLDVSKNTALTTLWCQANQLTNLDVSKNTSLTRLYCYNNQLTSLDVSKNTALTDLNCYDNQLTSLDVSKNTALTGLVCSENQLTSFDVSQNTALITLSCSSNQLTSLDVSKNTTLTWLYCGSNQLTSLDVSSCTALTSLSCYTNELTSLDVSKNAALSDLTCYRNQLTAAALNALFGTLHSNTIANGKEIDVRYNPGTGICDQSIATAKGWTVIIY